MGANHAANILAGKVKGMELTAVADFNEPKRARFPGIKGFVTADELIASRLVDAVLIATPHYDHPITGVKALKAGLHVLVEKPLAVHKADGQRLIAAHKNKRLVFATMLNQRTDGFYRKIRELVRGGELGRLRRINWIITTWFRTEAYYKSSSWRATWAGEGGGVLLNQCVHNLDLFQWIFGMPKQVRAFCGFGRYRNVEVEDDVTAYFEYAPGTSAVFITSTGEAPGTNRLEVVGERGKVVYENDRLVFTRNEMEMSRFAKISPKPFARPEAEHIDLPAEGHGGQHVEVLQNFADAILHRTPLIAPAVEGLPAVELANAMLLSSWKGTTVELPINAAYYERKLRQCIAESKVKVRKKKTSQFSDDDLAKSFNR